MSAPCVQWARAHQPTVAWNNPNSAENSSSASNVAFPVRLLPLDDSHFDALFAAGGRDESVAKFSPPANPAVFESAQHMREHYNARLQSPAVQTFVVVDAVDPNIVMGSFSLLDMQSAHRSLEIGAVWIGAAFRGSARSKFANVAAAAVYLCLQHAFDTLGCYRVWWKCDSRNEASKKTAEKSGAQLEGVLRSHMIMRDGHRRDSVIYSWLDTEWAALRIALCAKFGWSLPVVAGVAASTCESVVE